LWLRKGLKENARTIYGSGRFSRLAACCYV